MAREQYKPHPHVARNANHVHTEEQMGFNQRLAIVITNALGSVPCMYLFIILALIGFPGLRATAQQYVQWISQTCIQLVALSVLGIAQNLLNRHAEIQSDAMYDTDVKTFHDAEILIKQNNALQEDIDVLKNGIGALQSEQSMIRSMVADTYNGQAKQTEMLVSLAQTKLRTARQGKQHDT